MTLSSRSLPGSLRPADNIFFKPTSQKTQRLPDWLDHFNRKDLQVFFRCFVSVWVYTLFIVINPTLRALGTATFFGAILIFIAPPSGVIFIGLMTSITLFLGISLGWAWGTIAMKAALATRPAEALQRKYQLLQTSAATDLGSQPSAQEQAEYTQETVLNGFFLDSRVTITYFCLMIPFIYLVARLRVKAPKLGLLAVFAIVIGDLFLMNAPAIPTFNGTIPLALIKPAAVATGVAFICNILIFPRSTSTIVLDGMYEVLSPMSHVIEAHHINLYHPSERMNLRRLEEVKQKTIEAYHSLEGSLTFLPLDFSTGRYSAADITSLQQPLRKVLTGFFGLVNFWISSLKPHGQDIRLLRVLGASVDDNENASTKTPSQRHLDAMKFRLRSESPAENAKSDLTSLGETYEPLLLVCQEALIAILQGFDSGGLLAKQPSAANLQTKLDRNDGLLESLAIHRAAAASQRSAREHDSGTDEAGGPTPRTIARLLLMSTLEERTLQFASALEDLLRETNTLEEKRVRYRIWLPPTLRNLFSWAVTDDSPRQVPPGNTDSLEKDTRTEKNSATREFPPQDDKNNDEEHTKRVVAQLLTVNSEDHRRRSTIGRFVLSVGRWLGSTEGLYALRVTVVTIAIAAIAVIPSSAGFFYREKGFWGLVMAQTCIMPYSADFVYGFFSRIVGTVVGGVTGLVAWYIGAGNGPGNPFGMAAAMAVVLVVAMWLRLFLPKSAVQATIMGSATCYLVVGYSWNDTHNPSYGDPGVGYSIFWRRLLLVLMGFCAASIVVFFPRPPSANRHYRRLLSESLGILQNKYSLFVQNARTPVADIEAIAVKAAIDTGIILLDMQPKIPLAAFELSSSRIDTKTLETICSLCLDLNNAMTELLLHVPRLGPKLGACFSQATGAFDDQCVSEIMAIVTLSQHALVTSNSLPRTFPLITSLKARLYRDRESMEELVQTVLRCTQSSEEEATRFCSAVAAYLQLLACVDEVILVLQAVTGLSDLAATL